MISRECIILIFIMIYSAVGFGTILRIENRTNIPQKLFIFFCMPLIVFVSFFAWAGLYILSKNVKKKRLTGVFHFFTILPEICEGFAYDLFDFPSEDNNDFYKQTNDFTEYNDTSFIDKDENEKTRIVYLSKKKNKTLVINQHNTESYEDAAFANTKVR